MLGEIRIKKHIQSGRCYMLEGDKWKRISEFDPIIQEGVIVSERKGCVHILVSDVIKELVMNIKNAVVEELKNWDCIDPTISFQSIELKHVMISQIEEQDEDYLFYGSVAGNFSKVCGGYQWFCIEGNYIEDEDIVGMNVDRFM